MVDLSSAIEAILFASGEPVPIARISLILGEEYDIIKSTAEALAMEYEKANRGIRLLSLGSSLQMCSAPEYYEVITKILEQRRTNSLSQTALETLAIIAYYQPVTRVYIEKLRGVDSAYTVGLLEERGLVECCGRMEAPGRPALFRTTSAFLRTMGISSLDELPALPDVVADNGIEELRLKIEELRESEESRQMSFNEIQPSNKE